MACKHEASALQCKRCKDKSRERNKTVKKSKKITIKHYVEITAKTNLDDYRNFYVTNEGGISYIVELWD